MRCKINGDLMGKLFNIITILSVDVTGERGNMWDWTADKVRCNIKQFQAQ